MNRKTKTIGVSERNLVWTWITYHTLLAIIAYAVLNWIANFTNFAWPL